MPFQIKPFCAALLFCLGISGISAQVQTIELQAVQDATVNTLATTNSGTDGTLVASIYPLDIIKVVSRSFIKFNIQDAIATYNIPSNAVILSATLSLGVQSEDPTINNSSLVLRSVSASWTETGITYKNMPAVSTVNQVLTSSKTILSGYTHRRFNVTQLVSDILKGVSANEGWSLGLVNESLGNNQTAIYHSRETTVSPTFYIPTLTIRYCIPYTVVSAAITHASTATSTDGSITPVLANGSSAPTYKWYKNGTTLVSQSSSLTGQTYGWYGLEITGSEGDISYYSFIIGAKCQSFDIAYNPGPKYIDDISYRRGSLTPAPTSIGNSVVNQAIFSPYVSAANQQHKYSAAIKFRLWVPADLEVTKAGLNFYSATHSGTDNVATLSRNTTEFYEFPIYYSLLPTPSVTATGALVIPQKAPGAHLVDFETKNFWNEWRLNNVQNYGMSMTTNTSSGTVAQTQSYHSADASTGSLPNINFTFLKDCDSKIYTLLRRELDASYAIVDEGELNFYFEEEYKIASNKYLQFKIFNSAGQLIAHVNESGTVLLGSVLPVPYSMEGYGRTLKVNTLGLQTNKFYTFEVKLMNGDKKYLKFLYKN